MHVQTRLYTQVMHFLHCWAYVIYSVLFSALSLPNAPSKAPSCIWRNPPKCPVPWTAHYGDTAFACSWGLAFRRPQALHHENCGHVHCHPDHFLSIRTQGWSRRARTQEGLRLGVETIPGGGGSLTLNTPAGRARCFLTAGYVPQELTPAGPEGSTLPCQPEARPSRATTETGHQKREKLKPPPTVTRRRGCWPAQSLARHPPAPPVPTLVGLRSGHQRGSTRTEQSLPRPRGTGHTRGREDVDYDGGRAAGKSRAGTGAAWEKRPGSGEPAKPAVRLPVSQEQREGPWRGGSLL